MSFTLIDDEPKAASKKGGFTLLDEETGVGTFGQNLAAGAGKALYDIGRGAGQFLRSGIEKASPRLAAASGLPTQADIDEARALDAPLMATGAGMGGNFAGNVAATVPAMFVPGANTYVGATTLGALMGASQPVATGESRLLNTALGGAGGAAGKAGGDFIANKVGARLANQISNAERAAVQNAERDATFAAGRQLGLVSPPSQAGGGMATRALEGFSNKTNMAQTASVRNQEVVNNVVRKSLGLADDAPLNEATFKAVRDVAGEAYERVGQLKNVLWDKEFERAVSQLSRQKMGGATSNPADEAISGLINELRANPRWTGQTLIADIKNLREMAKANFGAADRAGGDVGKSALATAQQKAADILEDLAERNLALNNAPKSLISEFREARKLIAKSYTAENALREGGGNVSAKKLSQALNKGVPLEGDVRTVAKFANTFDKAMQDPAKIGSVPMFTLTDLVLGAAGGTVNPALAAAALARPAAREAALSPAVQNALASHSYGPGAATRLADLIAWRPEFRQAMTGAGAAGALTLGNLIQQ